MYARARNVGLPKLGQIQLQLLKAIFFVEYVTFSAREKHNYCLIIIFNYYF